MGKNLAPSGSKKGLGPFSSTAGSGTLTTANRDCMTIDLNGADTMDFRSDDGGAYYNNGNNNMNNGSSGLSAVPGNGVTPDDRADDTITEKVHRIRDKAWHREIKGCKTTTGMF